MSESTETLKFSYERSQELLRENMNALNSSVIEIGKKLDEAKKSGNEEEYSALMGDRRILEDDIEKLQNESSLLEIEEKKPEFERISKLREELKQPYVSPPPRGYSPYGLMPTAFNATENQSNFPTRQEQKERKRDIVAQLYNAPTGSREAEQLPAGVRAGVGALPTPESELEYLKRTYPNASIAPIDVAGQTEYLIKNQDGTSFTTLDKGIAGTAGMLAVEGPLTIAEVGAGLGTLAATKSPITATLAAGGTRATLGPLADSIVRASLEMPQQVGESFARRGTEAAIGTALGLGIDVIPSSVVAARMPGPFKNEFLKAYKDAAKGLGLPETVVPLGARFGPQGLEAGQELAGIFPRSQNATYSLKAQESLLNIFKGIKKGVPATANDFSSIAVNQEGQRRALANSIARTNNKSVSLIDDSINKILKPRAKTNVDDLGNILRTNIEAAEAQAIKSTTEQYNVLADVANQAGFKMEARELIDMLPQIKSRINPGGAFDEAAVKGVENRLKEVRDAPGLIAAAQVKLAKVKSQGERQDLINEIQRLQNINKPLDFNAFDAYIRAFNDARPDNAVGGTTKDVLGAGISAELSALRRDIYSKFNATAPNGTIINLGDEFQKATELVEARGAFEGNTLGGILKDVVGEQAKTPRDIVSSVLKEPATINRILQATKQLELDDPAQAGITDKLQGMMRLQYLNDLGMGSKKGVTVLNYDQGMLDALYGNKSAAAARGLDSLNNKLRVLKSANVPDMTLTDLNALSSALSQDARDKIADGIIKRTALEKQEQALVQSSVFKAALSGNFENIDPDLLSKSILSKSSTIGQAKSTMAKLSQSSPESRNLFKGDFLRNLLDDYPGGTPSANAPYTPPFDTKKFLADWESPTGKSQFAQKVETVLGNQDAQKIYNFAKLWEGNIIADASKKGFQGRLIASQKGSTFVVPISPLLSYGKNRYLAAMLLTGKAAPGLRSALARNALPGEVNDVYAEMFKKMLLTRQGITALTYQASSDPEFSAELQNTLKDFEEKEGLDLNQK